MLEGMAANVFVVSAKSDGSVELYLVPADAAGVSRTKLSLADSRGAANVEFKDVAVGDDAKLAGGAALLEKGPRAGRPHGGNARRPLQAFEVTLDYLKTACSSVR